MIDILLIAVYIACTAVFFTNYNTPYLSLLDRLKAPSKPFRCALCFSWWLGIAYTIACYTHLAMTMIAPLSALLAIVIERLVKLIPIVL